MTPREIAEARAKANERRRELFISMSLEQRQKHRVDLKRETQRDYYYLNRYGMTEEEYKKRKRGHS